MTRNVHEGLNKDWKPTDLNWWMSRRHRFAPNLADNLALSCEGTDLNWLAIAVVGMIRTTYFKKQGVDAFGIGEHGLEYEAQADLAPLHWDKRESVESTLSSRKLLFAYDTIYAKAAAFLDDMAAQRSGEVVGGVTAPGSSATETQQPRPPMETEPVAESPVDQGAGEQEPPSSGKKSWWLKLLIPLISGIVGMIAGALGPWGKLLEVVWGAIKQVIGG